uniref:ATP synthase complex subunit 8 n=1 Tax=Gallotia atlantica TaxID=39309 RepID=A0A8A3WJ52_9SAUR|nr:ATP synthase F0 subunit 8 [Gallotia atlantica]QTA72529.1 ATP synthase F0 subunit 8 [Gallotia atlantica]
MPQLNPTPWFLIFVLTWTTLLIIMLPKILNLFPTTQATYNQKNNFTTNWNWPWL